MEGVTSSPQSPVPLVKYFDLSNNGFAWRSPRPEQIMDRRAILDDKLIFDVLLISGGIRDPDFLYPPRDAAGLERLLEAIETSTYDTLKKHTLVYFLLKWHQDGREQTFKKTHCIPPQFAALADAYWYLDTGITVPKAVSILSDSRINRDFASKIIHAITLTPQPGPLLLKYVRTAKPPLVEPPDMLRYVVALAESSIVEAWQYQRSFSEKDEMRPRLFRRILDWAISPAVRTHALKSFISLPLSPFEQGLLNDIALKPSEEYDSHSVALIQDLVCVRYIELGKYIDAIKIDRKFSAAGFDQRESSDRKALLKDLHESLSPVEKSLLEAEITPFRKENAPPPETPAVARKVAMETPKLSQSWEDVPVPGSLSKSTNTPLRNIQIPQTPPVSSAPRFTVPTATAPVPSVLSNAPLLPVSNGSTSISANGFTPRKSGPLSTLGKGRPSLSGVGQRLAMGAGPAISSPVSGMRLPAAPNKPTSHVSAAPTPPVFVSTVNQANAFYQPKQTSQKRPLPEEEEEEPIPEPEPLSAVTSESQHDEGMDVDADKEEESVQDKGPKDPEVAPGWKDVESVNQLNKSIFNGSAPASPASAHIASARYSTTNGTASAKKAKMQPPGAFDDEESHHEHTEPEPEPEHKPRATRKRVGTGRVSRTQSASVVAHDTSISPQAKPIRKTRSVKQEKKPTSRRIPGGLLDEEDGDHEEEGDKLAPLRGITPAPTSVVSSGVARSSRKPSRSVAGSEGGSDGEGGPRTRRSSRLSTTGSVRNASPEAAKEPAVAKRKTARTATTKRKK